ncbi:MAG: glycogen debranching protein GlgX [Fusobacteriota bacterium]
MIKVEYKIKDGTTILGATVDSIGVNFAVFSRNAKSVTLEIYENYYDRKPIFKHKLDEIRNKTGDIWHIHVGGIKDRQFYGWRVDGEYEPTKGHRFNKNKLLIDPYAKAVSNQYDFGDEASYSYDKKKSLEDDTTFSEDDSAQLNSKSIIIDESQYDWDGDKHPRIPLKDTFIYEMHVRLFTQDRSSGLDDKDRGTFEGILEKIQHLKELGITAIELLPIFEFNINAPTGVNPATGEPLKDIWGYNPLCFFAVTGNYTKGPRLGEQVFKFKDFVKALHQEGMEVILDVVYNHTGEGNEKGPSISFKGFDNSIYYMLSDENKRYYCNYSGTGNTLNCSHAVVKEMIIDSLRYWVQEMHVDGFRFDLAAILGRSSNGEWIGDLSLLKDIADDPIISGSKLIAEGWDAGGGYHVGEFPVGWAEWNGKFRDTVRKFIKGDHGVVGDLATRLVGSPDLFKKYGRKPYHSINFITAHDGFTMWDLVSYNEKHNFENGERNRDGANDNYSYNHGVEGKTGDPEIINLRKKQVKNFFVILGISQGVPMMLMGDEFARSKGGNNNTYCHDNDINWLDWDNKKEYADINEFVKKMFKFRKEHHSLKRAHFFLSKDLSGDGVPDITWHGTKLEKPDWGYFSRVLAFMISGEDFMDKETPSDNDIYVALNAHTDALDFELPKLKGKNWYRIVDTDKENAFLDEGKIVTSKKYKVEGRSSIILISKKI